MNKILKNIFIFAFVLISALGLVACESTTTDNENKNSKNVIAESVELGKSTLDDVEFENAETVKLEKKDNQITISGSIQAMSKSQKLAFGVQDVTHVVTLKFTFDKERTISKFEIIGNTKKVYSVNKDDENYVGSISDLLDSEDGEDAYAYLILAANTKKYTLKATYSDKTTSEIKIDITATLATAVDD